jgi:hypothetical protein
MSQQWTPAFGIHQTGITETCLSSSANTLSIIIKPYVPRSFVHAMYVRTVLYIAKTDVNDGMATTTLARSNLAFSIEWYKLDNLKSTYSFSSTRWWLLTGKQTRTAFLRSPSYTMRGRQGIILSPL